MAERYQFQYYPVTGKLTGNQMIEQTEQAINELAQNVYEGSAQVEVINTIVNQAEQNAEQALEKATQALESTGRVYLDELTAVNLNNYYNSELLYIGDETSENLPVADTGFLEVKTNDSMTNAAQVFIADSSGLLYFRQATIIPQEVGSVTTYDVTWGMWFTYTTQEYVGDNYLSLAGGSITGDLSVSGTITGDLVGNADTATNATNATNDGNGNPIAATYLPLNGGTMTGTIQAGNTIIVNRTVNNSFIQLNGGNGDSNGANLMLFGKDESRDGGFWLQTHNGSTTKRLEGKSNGTLTWNGGEVLTNSTVGKVVTKSISSSVSLSASTAKTITSISLTAGTWVVNGHVKYDDVTANRVYGLGITTSPNRYAYANDGTIALHSASNGTVVANVTNVLTLGSTTTVYLCGYVTASATAGNAHITAVRIV